MKLIIQQVIIGTALAIMLFVLSGCKEVFHSKEDINYTELVLDMEHNDSVRNEEKDYYKFYAEQGKTYNVNLISGSSSPSYINIVAFWYDTEATVIGELKFSKNGREKTSFTASRSGNVVIRLTASSESATYASGGSYTIKITQ
jgi:hypothetical protein